MRLRALAMGLAVSAVVTVILAGDWARTRIDAVVTAAEAIAGDKPYCIQVAAKRADFVQARARIDFSPLTMRTKCPGGWCWQYHAILGSRGRRRARADQSGRTASLAFATRSPRSPSRRSAVVPVWRGRTSSASCRGSARAAAHFGTTIPRASRCHFLTTPEATISSKKILHARVGHRADAVLSASPESTMPYSFILAIE